MLVANRLEADAQSRLLEFAAVLVVSSRLRANSVKASFIAAATSCRSVAFSSNGSPARCASFSKSAAVT